MSRQLKVQPKEKLTDLEAVYKGLLDLGFKDHDLVFDLENPQPIIGYDGQSRGQNVQILIKRRGLNNYCVAEYGRGGASNDAGFFLNAEGEIEMSISAYDQTVGVLNSDAWQKKLKHRHDVNKAIKSAEKFGFKFQKETVKGGKTVLKMKKGW